MKTKHTPGPWTVIEGESHETINIEHVTETPSLQLVAKIMPYSDNKIANSKLIAAAPELLEACEKALIHLDVAGIEKGLQHDLKLAIQKATQ